MPKQTHDKYKTSENVQKTGSEKPEEIVHTLLSGLNKQLNNTISEIKDGNQPKAKKSAEKAQRIAHALQTALDHKDGGRIAEDLEYLYNHIRFATERFINDDKTQFMDSAFFVSSEILDGWKGMVSKVA